ncbi:unnamed protein product [Moneuplotes crassus]|uniref:Cyclic nucleotide-binding domain-containing protein n=1 Tax=Euplotes crassus TaxID=5936 RepID=A0AAD1XVN9_EUPCR|nr:unnamed protein product [Moneuplotes crassus]
MGFGQKFMGYRSLKVAKPSKNRSRRVSAKGIRKMQRFTGKRATLSMASFAKSNVFGSSTSGDRSKSGSFQAKDMHKTQVYKREVKKITKSIYKSTFHRNSNPTLPQLGSMLQKNRHVKKSFIRALAGKFLIDKFVINEYSKERYFLEILKKKPRNRTKREISRLTQFLGGIEFFKKYIKEGNEGVVGQCSSQLKLATFKKGERIMKYGELGDKFYVILQGSCKLFLKYKETFMFTNADYVLYLMSHETLGEDYHKVLSNFRIKKEYVRELEQFYAQHKDNSLQVLNKIISMLHGRVDIYTKRKFIISFLKHQATLKDGQEFGELALINSKPRSATIIAEKDTICAVLEKDQFKRILEKHEVQKQEVLLKAIESFSLFNNLSRVAKSKILKIIHRCEVSKGVYLYKEGETKDTFFETKSVNSERNFRNFYFVLNGELEVTKKVNFKDKAKIKNGSLWRNPPKTTKPNKVNDGNSNPNNFIKIVKYSKLKLDPLEVVGNPNFWKRHRVLLRGIKEDDIKMDADDVLDYEKEDMKKKDTLKIKQLKISKIFKRQIVGLEDIIHRFKERFTSVQVISDEAELLVINYDSLIKNLPSDEETPNEGPKKNMTTVEILQNYSMKKINFLSYRVEKIISGESELDIKRSVIGIKEEEKEVLEEKNNDTLKRFQYQEEKEFVNQLQGLKIKGIWTQAQNKRAFVKRSPKAKEKMPLKTSFYTQLIKEDRQKRLKKRASSVPEIRPEAHERSPKDRSLLSDKVSFTNQRFLTMKSRISRKRNTRNGNRSVMNMHIRTLKNINTPFLQSSLKGSVYDLEKLHSLCNSTTVNTVAQSEVPYVIHSLKKPGKAPSAIGRFYNRIVKKPPMRRLSIQESS